MADPDGISAQALSDTIGAIYDCALDPERWHDALGRIAKLGASPFCGLAVQDLKNPETSCLIDYGYPPAYCELAGQYVDHNPLMPSVCLLKVGDVLTLGMACSDQEHQESRYYQEVQKPFGLLDTMGLLALRTGGRIAYIHASRMQEEPRYSEREIRLFKLLSPHVCRTLAITDALDLRTLRSEMLEATLDGLTAGVYLTARDGRMAYMNAAAERQVKSGDALRIVNKRIHAVDASIRTALTRAIDEVASNDMAAHPGGHSLAIPDAEGSGYVATLLPIERGGRRSIMAPFEASVAVFVQDPADVPLMPGEAFGRLYGLTGGELRVLLTLAQGINAKEAADMLGIGEATVRTHLQHLFSKTATSRQSDLLHLFRNAAPPVRAANPEIHMQR